MRIHDTAKIAYGKLPIALKILPQMRFRGPKEKPEVVKSGSVHSGARFTDSTVDLIICNLYDLILYVYITQLDRKHSPLNDPVLQQYGTDTVHNTALAATSKYDGKVPASGILESNAQRLIYIKHGQQCCKMPIHERKQ